MIFIVWSGRASGRVGRPRSDAQLIDITLWRDFSSCPHSIWMSQTTGSVSGVATNGTLAFENFSTHSSLSTHSRRVGETHCLFWTEARIDCCSMFPNTQYIPELDIPRSFGRIFNWSKHALDYKRWIKQTIMCPIGLHGHREVRTQVPGYFSLFHF